MADAAQERLHRLLTLVPWLSAHSGVSKAAAATHFGLTEKQLEADLELVTFTGPGVYGGELVDIYFEDETITVYDSQGLDRPLQLTSDEVSTLLIGLRALQQLPDADVVAIASAIDKLTSVHPDAHELQVDITTPDAAAVVAEAIRTRRDLDIEYLHPLRDDTRRRTITPIRMFSADGADYVEAWCHVAEAQRTFRIDRMLSAQLSHSSVPVPDTETLNPQRRTARVTVQPWAQHVLEGVPAVLTETPDGLRAEIAFADDRWLVQWTVASGAGVRVEQPEDVQSRARHAAEAALLAYGSL